MLGPRRLALPFLFRGGGIPRQIHQLWIVPKNADPTLPANVVDYISEWRRLHPDFNHVLWTIDDVLGALPRDASSSLREALEVCRFEAMKSDLTRLFLLYHKGGFWIDLKVKPLQRWLHRYIREDLLLIEHFVSEFIPNPKNVLMNCLFGCAPRNQFIGQCLELALSNIRNRVSSTVWAISGPKVLMDARQAFQLQQRRDIKAHILSSQDVWDRLIQNGLGSYNKPDQHWSVREQKETMYLDRPDFADKEPIWRRGYQ